MNEDKIKKSSNRKVMISIVAGIAAILIIAIICVILYARSGSSQRRLQEQLDLGHRYLSELNYEKAIAAFEAVIEIDPKNVEAYLGLADAYEAMADFDNALTILRRAYELTGEEVFSERIERIEHAGASGIIVENLDSQTVAEDDTWREDFADLKDMWNEYEACVRYDDTSGDADWRECFLTIDELKQSYDPLINRIREWIEYRKDHSISPKDEMDFFGVYMDDYILRDLYICVHEFDESAKLNISSGEDIVIEYDEYNRMVYFQQSNGYNTTFVWGNDGCVSSFTAVYTDVEWYPAGTVEEWSFQYDNGRIVSTHIRQTNGDTKESWETDMIYTYDGNTVTETYLSGGEVSRTVVYEINRFGGGTEISSGDTYD
jgi:hypothetical protein